MTSISKRHSNLPVTFSKSDPDNRIRSEIIRLDDFAQKNTFAAMRLTPMSLMYYTPVLNLQSDEARQDCVLQLSAWLADLFAWFKLQAKPEGAEIGQIAYFALEKYGDLSMPDFWAFCKFAKGGSMVVDGITRKFELPYNRLDAVVLYDWLAIYREAKNEARERLHQTAKNAQAEPFFWTDEHQAAFDSYMADLRASMNERKAVDNEALDRERMARREQMVSISMNDLHGATTEELEGLVDYVAGDAILMEAVRRMLALRKGAGE